MLFWAKSNQCFTFDCKKSMSLILQLLFCCLFYKCSHKVVLLLLEEHNCVVMLFVCFCLITAGAFEDEDIIHVEGTVDPVRDMEIIHEELRLKDVEMIGPIIDKLEKTAIRGGDKKLKPEYVSQCPSRPFASPHSKAQIITLPHTWPRRKNVCFF